MWDIHTGEQCLVYRETRIWMWDCWLGTVSVVRVVARGQAGPLYVRSLHLIRQGQSLVLRKSRL